MKRPLRTAKYGLLLALALVPAAALGYANTPPIDQSYNNRIIDDSLFINSGTMTVAQIQAFLNSKVPTCDSNHPNPDGTPPATPYVCLKDYVDPTVNKSAAQLIYDEAQSFGMNPQVILVTLQKEQSLVTDTWPYPSQYKSAMGYGCPESQSVCDSQYYGFYNQVHLGTKLLRVGEDRNCGNSQSYPGWTVSSQWQLGKSPAVDGVPTYLASCATGALYNYTPHRPDSAYTARNGTYYYGNYNFVSFFTSWFGPSQVTFLAKSTASNSVYLINGSAKLPVLSTDILNTFANFGPVKIVAQSFLDTLSTSTPLSRLGRDANTGNIYLLDGVQKIQFADCAMVTTYGYDCTQAVNLSGNILSGFSTSNFTVTNIIKGSGQSLYKVEAGKKRLIPDMATMNEYGLANSPQTFLTDAMVGNLPDGAPLVRDQVVVVNADTGQAYLFVSSAARPVPSLNLYLDWRFNALPSYSFPAGLVSQLAMGPAITSFASDSGGNKFLLDSGGKRALGATATQWTANWTSLPDALINAVPAGSAVGQLVKGSGPSVYLVEAQARRWIPTGSDFLRSGYSFSNVSTITDDNLGTLPVGIQKFGSLRLLKTASDPTVVMVDGNASWRLPSPATADALGLPLSQTVSVDGTTFGTYAQSGTLSNLITDGTTRWLADSGSLHAASAQMQTAYNWSPAQFVQLGSLSTSNLAGGSALTQFIKGSASTIYQVQGGSKQPFASYQAYQNAGGQPSNTITLSDGFIASLPTGQPIQ